MINARYIPALDKYLVFQGGLPKLATYNELVDCCCDVGWMCVLKTPLPEDDGRLYCVWRYIWVAPAPAEPAECGDGPGDGDSLGCKTYAEINSLDHAIGVCFDAGGAELEPGGPIYNTAGMHVIASAHDTLEECQAVCGVEEPDIFECLPNVDGRLVDDEWEDDGVKYTVVSLHDTLTECEESCGEEEL